MSAASHSKVLVAIAVAAAGASIAIAQGGPSSAGGKSPEIEVLQGAPIPDGGTDLVGNAQIGKLTRTYTVQNSGNAELYIGGVYDENPVNVSAFEVTKPPPLVPAGTSASFTVQFDVGIDGPFSLDLALLNNDSDESPYQFTVVGTGIGGTPDMSVSVLGTAVPDGGTYDLMNVAVGTAVRTYTIENSGSGTLSVDQVDAVNLVNVSNFAVVTAPASTVTPNASTDVTIQFEVEKASDFSFELQIANNDNDENPYDITFKGVGVGG